MVEEQRSTVLEEINEMVFVLDTEIPAVFKVSFTWQKYSLTRLRFSKTLTLADSPN